MTKNKKPDLIAQINDKYPEILDALVEAKQAEIAGDSNFEADKAYASAMTGLLNNLKNPTTGTIAAVEDYVTQKASRALS